MALGFAAGTPQQSDARSRPRSVGVAECSFKRRDPALTKVARWRSTYNGLVEITSKDDSAELHAQVTNELQECDAHGPPLGTLVVHVDVGDREAGTRLAGRPAQLAGNHHALDSPRGVAQRARDLDRRAREVARKSILVEKNSALELEHLLQRVVNDEPGALLDANNMPRAVEV